MIEGRRGSLWASGDEIEAQHQMRSMTQCPRRLSGIAIGCWMLQLSWSFATEVRPGDDQTIGPRTAARVRW